MKRMETPAKVGPMQIVSYARCSTPGQVSTSLPDQKARIDTWLDRTGHQSVGHYGDQTSGSKNMDSSEVFAELREALDGVDAVVVDALDRLSRNAFDGVTFANELRKRGVRLIELENGDAPLDLHDADSREYVLDRFKSAEAEWRRASRRQSKRYNEQRKRGVAVVNRPAFGLRLGGTKANRTLEADPQQAPIVKEIDRQILAGKSRSVVLAWLANVAGAPKSKRGLALFLRNSSLVDGGVRTLEAQQQLNAIMSTRKQAYGPDRTTRSVRTHELAGLIECGVCGRKLFGRHVKRNPSPMNLVCEGQGHPATYFTVEHVWPLLLDKLTALNDASTCEAVLASWVAEPTSDDTAALRKSLGTSLAEVTAREATLDADARRALLLVDAAPDEAKRMIAAVAAERAEVAGRGAALTAQIAGLPAERVATFTADDLREWAGKVVVKTVAGKRKGTAVDLRGPVAKIVAAIGAPRLSREDGALRLDWAMLD